MEQVRLLRIFVASPKDVKAEREALDRVIDELNQGLAADRALRLKLVRWEKDTYPGFDKEGPQGLIDPLLRIEDCEVLIGIFWKRFGTPTHESQSGTEHEFKIAYEAWKKNGRPQIFVYFNQQPAAPSNSEEADQWRRVLEFRENFPKEGLWWPYKGKTDFENLVRGHLRNFIRQQFLIAGSSPANKVNGTPDQTQTQHRNPNELDALYLEPLLEQVGTVYIFGERRDLKQVFVELNVIEEYERPLMQVEYLDVRAAQLQQQNIFETPDKTDEAEPGTEDKDKRKRVIKPEELLRGRTRAIITGTPGCGKTTLVKYVALRAKEAKRLFPIYLELKLVTEEALQKAGHNLVDLLFELAIANRMHLDNAESQQFRQYFYSRLAAHEAVICLDGLDEVSDPALLARICNSVSAFINDPYGDNTLIITTRTYALQRIEGMKQMEIAPLNRLQIEEFLDHYYGGEPATTSLLRAFRQRTQLRELMRIPFLLAVIFQLHRTKNIIIQNRLELYRQITYQLARNLDREKAAVRRGFLIKDPEGSLKLDFLSYLACDRLFIEDLKDDNSDPESARLVFTGATILNKTKEFVEKSKLTHISPYDLAADVKATALLREVGADIYAFAHLTIQEYLAALMLKDHANFEQLFWRAYFNPALAEGEVLPMVLGLVDNPTRFYRMLEGLPESLTFINLRLRARGLGYVARLDSQSLTVLADQLIEFITQQRFEDTPFEQAVNRSFAAATGKPLESITESVVELLHGKENELQLRIVAVLEQIGGESALTALIEMLGGRIVRLRRDASENQLGRGNPTSPLYTVTLRTRVAEALGRMGGERSAQALVKALTDKDHYVQYAASDALGQIGGAEATAALMSALKSSDIEMRRRSAEALMRIGGDHAGWGLPEILESRDLYMTEKATAVFGRIGGKEAVNILLKTLATEDNDLRLAAVGALGQIGGTLAEDALLSALKHSDVDVKMRTARELGTLGSTRSVDALIDALQEDDIYVRASVAGALGQTGGERAFEALLVSLGDTSGYVRGAAVVALGQLADERAIPSLVNALEDPDRTVRLKAVESLRQIEGEAAASGLIAALDNDDSKVRKKAVKVISRRLGKSSLDILLQAINSDASDVRSAVAAGLGQCGGERALEALIVLLDDPSGYVRGAAADALGQLADERAIASLVKASEDSDIYVRGLAVVALGQIGGEQTLEALLPAVRDETLYVRIRAVAALGQVGGERVLHGLIEALGDANFDVRVIAADSLTQIGGERAAEILFHEGRDKSPNDRWRFYARLAWAKIEQDVAKLIPALEDDEIGSAVADALGRIGGEQVVAILIGALSSAQVEVRKHAAAALAKIDKEEMGRGLLNALFYPHAFVRKKAAQAIAYYKVDERTFEQLSIMVMEDTDVDVQAATLEALEKYSYKLKLLGQEIPGIKLAHGRTKLGQ